MEVITLKLDHECIRDLLLYLENNLTYNGQLNINNLKIRSYSKETLMYTADKLIEAEYLNAKICWNYSEHRIIMVESITFKGHQFLDNIRDDSVWKDTKNVLSKFKSTSINFIADVSSQIIANLISKQLGFN